VVWDRWIKWGLAAACAVCLAAQLLFPGYIGIANNGDFGKVYGWLCLAPRGPETNFVYFQPDYVWSARNYWNSPYHSSESALAWAATRMAGATNPGAGFNLRWLGAIHAVLWLSALALLMAGRRWTAALAPVLIFTDVSYTAYLNSFYMDAAALSGLLLMTAGAVWIASGEQMSARQGIVFTGAALLFVTSKAQHAVWMTLPAAFLIACGVWRRESRRVAWCGAGVVVLAGCWMLASTDQAYRGQAMFNVLFYRLAPRGADLASLGVAPEEMRYRGMHSYMEGSPANDRGWTEAFYRRTGFARLVGWYARHPASTLGFLRETLVEGAPEMRPVSLSNFRVEDGRAPGARTSRFAAWSDLRSALLRRWPWHIVMWYAAFAIGCLVSGSRVAWVGLGVAVLGAGEFGAAALGDSLDAGRHLFLFHAATDLTICFAAGWAIQKAMRHKP
jgi:hypothetical protein